MEEHRLKSLDRVRRESGANPVNEPFGWQLSGADVFENAEIPSGRIKDRAKFACFERCVVLPEVSAKEFIGNALLLCALRFMALAFNLPCWLLRILLRVQKRRQLLIIGLKFFACG
ncbi:hypothetical protein [Paraburkholderia sp. MM6662-R1]|uniref:hypothetical protein n=1 Tax=Paraburkholderia sp. MM6662-R1 TaxID=2991066 RepID=UPI003D19C86E